jgi:hypothetical protein
MNFTISENYFEAGKTQFWDVQTFASDYQVLRLSACDSGSWYSNSGQTLYGTREFRFTRITSFAGVFVEDISCMEYS